MSETTTKSATRLFTEAAGIAGFPTDKGWPPELTRAELAALMAGCRRADDRKRYDNEVRLIATGIKGGKLQTVTALRPPSLADAFMAARRAREPGNSGWATNWDSDAPRRIVRIVRIAPAIELREVQAIDRASCASWLRVIEESPGEYVRAWLGDVWQAAAPIVVAGDTAQPVKRTRAALIAELQDQWPTIRRDLQDAARNGLSTAKLSVGRGWDKAKAIKWAEENGKLLKSASEAPSPAVRTMWDPIPAILPKVKP